MPRTPMPSPLGTNRAGLYLSSGSPVVAAYDAAPDTDGPDNGDWSALLGFLEDKLDEGDLGKVRRMLGLDNPDLTGANDRAIRRAADVRPAYAEDVRDRYRQGHITSQDMERLIVQGPTRQPTAADRRREAEMFPHAGRLKV